MDIKNGYFPFGEWINSKPYFCSNYIFQESFGNTTLESNYSPIEFQYDKN